MTDAKIFVDSDVIISSLISETGAAYLLLNQPNLNLFISNLSISEQKVVVKRLSLSFTKWQKLTAKLNLVNVSENIKIHKQALKSYVLDPNDAHILAGGIKSKAKFLITYNLKHFKLDKIKSELGILVISPGNFLQYLRSH